MKKTKKIICEFCKRDDFKSKKGLGMHVDKKHIIDLPKPPIITTTSAIGVLPEFHTLLCAKGQFEVGDVFYQVKKLVIKKLTLTEGSQDIKVEADLIKKTWSATRP